MASRRRAPPLRPATACVDVVRAAVATPVDERRRAFPLGATEVGTVDGLSAKRWVERPCRPQAVVGSEDRRFTQTSAGGGPRRAERLRLPGLGCGKKQSKAASAGSAPHAVVPVRRGTIVNSARSAPAGAGHGVAAGRQNVGARHARGASRCRRRPPPGSTSNDSRASS